MAGMVMASINFARGDSIDVSNQKPWEACGYCHNLDGMSVSPRFPHLAGQQKAYLVEQLMAFKKGERTNDDNVMQSMVQNLSNSDIDTVANYFSALKRPFIHLVNKTPSANIFHRGSNVCDIPACASCHGSDGNGQQGIPRLAGQQASYLRKQLDDFAEGRRVSKYPHTFARCWNGSQRQDMADFLDGAQLTAAHQSQ